MRTIAIWILGVGVLLSLVSSVAMAYAGEYAQAGVLLGGAMIFSSFFPIFRQ